MPQEAPAIESSFLFVREVPQDDGSVNFEEGFTHDTYRDFFRARAIANRINDGQATVDTYFEEQWSREAYWSSDDKRRIIDPASQDIVLFVSEMLEPSHARQLVHLLSRDQLQRFEAGWRGLGRFSKSMYTALRIMGTRDIGDDGLEGKIYNTFLEADMDSDLRELLDSRHSIPLLIRMVESNSRHAAFAVPLLRRYKVKEAKQALISFMDSGHDESWKAANLLLDWGFEEGVPFLRRCAIDTEHPEHVQIAYALHEAGYKDVVTSLRNYASDTNHPKHVDVAYHLYRWGYKDIVEHLRNYASDPNHPGHVSIACDLFDWGYTDMVVHLRTYASEGSVGAALTLFEAGHQEGFDYLVDCASDPENPGKNEAVKLLRNICLGKGDRDLLSNTFTRIYEAARGEDYSTFADEFSQSYNLHYIMEVIFKAGDEKSRARVYRELEAPDEELHRHILHAIARHRPKGANPYVSAYISRLEALEIDDSEGPLIKLVKTRKRENQIDLAIRAL